jgi:multiple antibiotic resistance protein
MEFSQILNYFFSLLVICNPLAALPVLISLTTGCTLTEKRQTARAASIAVAVILIIVTWIGGPLLNFVGIKVPAFQLMGGLVLLNMSFSMISAQPSTTKTEDKGSSVPSVGSIAVMPLAMPMMAGPGSWTTIIVNSSIQNSVTSQIYMSVCALLVALTIWVVLYFADPLEKAIGQSGINIFMRVSGLIIGALSVQSIAAGIYGLYMLYQV